MKHIEDDILKLCSFARSGLMTMQGKEYHRITHTECDFNDDHKHRVSVLNQNITLVDVRAAKNYAEGHVPGAINLPFDKFSRFEGTEKEFPELRKDGFNYIYCYELGCNLATKAARKLASLGYPVKEMKGGFNAWKDHSYPIEK